MSPTAEKPLQLLVVMSIGPKWQNIDLLRTAVLNCVAVIVGEGDASETVGIIVSELLENAIKYGSWTDEEQTSVLRLNIAGDHERMNIEVSSPTSPGSANYEELMKTLKWIASFTSPRDAYMERIREVAEGTRDGTSKMGLVRIAHEGPCTLEARLEADNTLVTTAKTYLAPRSRA
jgi:hypothetical protein